MTSRPRVRHWSLLALPLALFAATPSLQWCSGPWVPLTQEQFAACLASEFTGCAASVTCDLSSCVAASDAGATTAASNESVSRPPPLACEADALVREAGSCEEAEADASDPGRVFCVGSPAGGFGLRPAPEDDPHAAAAWVVAAITNLAPPSRGRGRGYAPPDTQLTPDARQTTAPIRGPPFA